jgi:hypothetical protein
VKDGAPATGCDSGGSGGEGAADVVDEDVEPTATLQDGLNDLPRDLGLTRIAEDVEGLVAVLLDLTNSPPGCALVKVENADASAE